MYAIGYTSNGQKWYYATERGRFATVENPDGFTKFVYYADAKALLNKLKDNLPHRNVHVSLEDVEALSIYYLGAN